MVDLYISNRLNIRKLLALFAVILLTGCTNGIPKELQWQNIQNVRYRSNRLEIGDIIIKNHTKLDPLTWFGHAAVLVSPYLVGDYPKLGRSYYEIDIYYWLLEKNRDVIVLRYKYFDDEFSKIFQKNLKKYDDKKYGFSSKNKYNNFYCSKYVWLVYLETAKELGYSLDIDNNGGLLVTPFDLLGNKNFKQILF